MLHGPRFQIRVLFWASSVAYESFCVCLTVVVIEGQGKTFLVGVNFKKFFNQVFKLPHMFLFPNPFASK